VGEDKGLDTGAQCSQAGGVSRGAAAAANWRNHCLAIASNENKDAPEIAVLKPLTLEAC
jgi:hypothetical protein